MKTVLLSSFLAVALFSGAAYAGETHHARQTAAASHAQTDQRFYSIYRNNAAGQQGQNGSSTYSVDPSPVSDQ